VILQALYQAGIFCKGVKMSRLDGISFHFCA